MHQVGFSLHDYIEMHGQQNIQFVLLRWQWNGGEMHTQAPTHLRSLSDKLQDHLSLYCWDVQHLKSHTTYVPSSHRYLQAQLSPSGKPFSRLAPSCTIVLPLMFEVCCKARCEKRLPGNLSVVIVRQVRR